MIKKILIILSLLCMTFAYSFAQISAATVGGMAGFIDNLDNSAVKRATAGEFSTDSDRLNAKDVFDLNRTIFSAGYVPNLNSSSSTAVQAFFGIPINNNAMYFGVAGVYEMSEVGIDYNNGSWYNTAGVYTPPTTGLFIGRHSVSSSTFAIRPVFKINDMISLHYLIARGNAKTNNQGYTALDLVNSENYTAITNSSGNSQWVHEVAVGVALGEMKLTIPVRLTVNEIGNSYSNGYQIVKTYTDAQNNSETITASTNKYSLNPINLAFLPEFYMPLVSGPMTGITVGLVLGFDIYGMGTKSSGLNSVKTVTAGVENSVKTTGQTNQKRFNMNIDMNFYPTLEWSLANDRVQLVMEPKVGFAINVTNINNTMITNTTEATGLPNAETTITSGNKYTIVETTPYVSFPIGTVFRPVNWFEFRVGISYTLGFNMWSISTETLAEQKYNRFNYRLSSKMDLFTGMGFIIGEDFFIDLFLVAGTENSTATSLLNIDSWGAQLSYRL